jgi:hypothetical protein
MLRVPSIGVAEATSTLEAACTPISTPSWSHSTSPSMTCSAAAKAQAAHPSSPTANWSAWPSLRCCWAATPNDAGCGWPTTAWATCSPTCPPLRPTTSGCGQRECWSRWPSATWPCRPRPGTTTSACWTPPRCRVRPRARRSNARRCGPMPAMATAPATTATSGAFACTCSRALMGCRSRGVWPMSGHPQAGRARGRPSPYGPPRSPRPARLGGAG